MRVRLPILALLILASANVGVHAAAPLTCTPDLFKDYSKGGYNDAATLQMLNIVDQSNYDKFKQNFAGNVTVPIYDVPVDFGVTYDSFKETRSRIFKEHQFSSSSNTSLQWLNIYYSASATTAYAKCLDAYVKGTPGIHVWAKDVSATGATVYVQWVPPAQVGSVTATITARGAPQWQDFTKDFGPSYSSNFAVKRQPDQEMRILVNVPGYADDLTIPADPRIATPPAAPAGNPKIIAIATTVNGSDANCAPARENTWRIDLPIRDVNHIGIGYVVEPEPFHRIWSPADFTMHDHHGRPGEPDPNRAVITYRFDKPARVVDVLLIQHTNGVTQIEGFVGENENAMESIGKSTSTTVGANLPLQDRRFVDGSRDVFAFPKTRQGRLFRIVITKTSGTSGYALYRAYPRDSNHKPFGVREFEEVAEQR